MKQNNFIRGGRLPDGLHSLMCNCDICFRRRKLANKASKNGGGSLRKKMMAERLKGLNKN